VNGGLWLSKDMCSSQSEADVTSPLPRVRVRRKASNVDFIDGPVDTDEENENIEKLVEADGDTDFLPSKSAKKRGRTRKVIKNKNTTKTGDAKTEMNNHDDNIAGKESRSINTTNQDTSTNLNTSTPAKSMKMARVLPGGASGLVDPGPDQLKLKSPSLEDDNAGPMIIDAGEYKHLDTNSLWMQSSKLGNLISVKKKNTTKIENTCVDMNNSVDLVGKSHFMVNSSKCKTSAESATNTSVRSKVTMVDFVSAGARDTDEENDNTGKLIVADNDADFVTGEENIVQKNRKRECPRKVTQYDNIYKVDDDNGTEEQNSIINLSTSDTSTDSNRSFPPKTVVIARYQRELPHDGSTALSSPRDSPAPSLMSVPSPSVGTSSGKSRYEQIRDDIIAERNAQLQAMGFFDELAAAKSEMTSKKSVVKQRVKAKKAKTEKMSGPRVSGPGHYHHHGSLSQGMVRKPGPTPVSGPRMPRRASSTGHRMPGPAPSTGHRMQGPTPVSVLTGNVARGGTHRRAPSYPYINNAQSIRASTPPPQPEPYVSHFPTQAAPSNMGTTFTRKQSPSPASSYGGWNLPPGISISRIQESDPGTGMTMTSLASALNMLGEREGTRRNVSYRLTERQIMALKTLGFEQELGI